jgi:protein transport protein SEC24
MLVVTDIDDVFLPLPDDLLVNLSESAEVVEKLLDTLPTMFQSTQNVDSALGVAVKAAFEVVVCVLNTTMIKNSFRNILEANY